MPTTIKAQNGTMNDEVMIPKLHSTGCTLAPPCTAKLEGGGGIFLLFLQSYLKLKKLK